MRPNLTMYLFFFLCASVIYGQTLALQKAQVYHEGMSINGWMMSEKLDGIRGYWDGNVMLSKSGNPIYPPKYFTENFPPFALDGELWIKRGSFEEIQAVVLDDKPSKEWHNITYNIFEVPYAEGNFTLRLDKAKKWFHEHPDKYVKFITQILCSGTKALQSFLDKVQSLNGEGVVVKNPKIPYFEGRSTQILKVKKFQDMEGEVIALNPGAGKYKNMMGSVTLKLKNGVIFKLGNGFTVRHRLNPPQIGDLLTFKYYGYTKNGKPKFASFMRTRDKKTIEKQ